MIYHASTWSDCGYTLALLERFFTNLSLEYLRRNQRQTIFDQLTFASHFVNYYVVACLEVFNQSSLLVELQLFPEVQHF